MQLTLSELMGEYAQLKSEIRGLKDKAEETRTLILLALKTESLDQFEDDNFSVKLSINKRRTFNRRKAEQFLVSRGEDIDSYIEVTDFETLKIKIKGGKEDE